MKPGARCQAADASPDLRSAGGFARRIRPHVRAEIEAARELTGKGDFAGAFNHLERAHVLGQGSTVEHVRVHWQMLLWAVRRRDCRELLAQAVRVAGAALLTAAGLVPEGNTGGGDVSPFRRLPIRADLARIIASTRSREPFP